MKSSLQPGVKFEFEYLMPASRTVPDLLPESPEFQAMPKVLATGYMVGLIEWTCIQAVNPHLDWPEEMTVGIGVELDHTAATPPGLTVRIAVELVEVEGRRLVFAVEAHDDLDRISRGRHTRAVIQAGPFQDKAWQKRDRALGSAG